MSVATRLSYTPEDLLAMPDRGRYELVGGQLLERNVSIESSIIAAAVNARLALCVLAQRLGWVFQADGGLQIFAGNPGKVRFGDGAFISRGRSPERPGHGHLRVAPELVIKVISPNDEAADVNAKVREYLGAGVLLVWVIYPDSRSIDVYRASAHNSQLAEGDELSGEDVVPGFSMPVRDVFEV